MIPLCSGQSCTWIDVRVEVKAYQNRQQPENPPPFGSLGQESSGNGANNGSNQHTQTEDTHDTVKRSVTVQLVWYKNHIQSSFVNRDKVRNSTTPVRQRSTTKDTSNESEYQQRRRVRRETTACCEESEENVSCIIDDVPSVNLG